MSHLQIVNDGAVVNVIVVGDSATIANDKKSAQWDDGSYSVDEGELWDVDGAQIGWAVSGDTLTPPEAPDASLDDLKAEKLLAIDNEIASILSDGAPVAGGLHVALDDSARADMGSMATTALAATAAGIPWPDSYKLGWISIENTRIPLETPADGLSLAAGVGDYYARARQNGRTLKDEVAAAPDKASLDAIDITAGWPA